MPYLDEDGVTRLTEDYLDIFALKEELDESDGTNAGPLYELSAKGHAEQFSTTGKNLVGTEINAYFSMNSNASSGYIVSQGTATRSYVTEISPNATYTISANGGNRLIIGIVDSLNPTTCLRAVVAAINDGTVNQTFATQADEHYVMVYLTNDVSTAPVEWAQLELGSTATEYEPYTGGAPSPSPDYPQEIQVVRGRNLCPYLEQGYWAFADGLPSTVPTWVRTPKIGCDPDTNYTAMSEYATNYMGFVWYDKNGLFISASTTGQTSLIVLYSAKSPSNAAYMALDVQGVNGGSPIAPNDIKNLQINAGSIPQPYVPYGHVGMEVRDPDTDELISCTALPLPSRSWVAGLPDGTADILTLDGAGKCEWELADDETTTAATDSVTGTIGVDVLSTTGQIADGATVLYKLATPIHESKGYIEDWPTDIPEGATITIPELDALNVKYFVTNESISQYAEQWYNRTKDSDIAEVEDAIGDLTSVVANLVTHDQFYFGYDEVNGKKMISIFKRGDI